MQRGKGSMSKESVSAITRLNMVGIRLKGRWKMGSKWKLSETAFITSIAAGKNLLYLVDIMRSTFFTKNR